MNKCTLVRFSTNMLTGLFLLFSTATIAQNCAGNLTNNSGFEQGTAGWNIIAGTATITSDANSGSSALELGGSSGSNIINQAMVGKPNTYYTLRASMKQNSTDSNGAFAFIKYYNASWQPLNSPGARYNGTSYREVVRNLKTPATTAYIAIEFLYNTTDVSKRVFIDDVCLVEEPNNPNCSISAQVVDLICNDNGTPVNQLDDTYTADVLVNGNNASSGFRLVRTNFFRDYGVYNQIFTTEVLRIGDGPRDFVLTDLGNENCVYTLTLNPPPTCSGQGSGCDIDLSLDQPICNNNGTPDNPLDDTFTFQATVTGTNTGTGWASTPTGVLSGISGNYNQATTIGPIDVYNSQISYFGVGDIDSNSPCFANQDINGPLACSNSNPNVCPGSLLQNGNFSNGLNGWQLSNVDFNGTTRQAIANVVSGGAFGQGVEICNDTQNSLFLSYIFQEFTVTPGPGKEGLVTWNYRKVSGDGNAHVRLYFEDVAGNSLFSQGLNPGFQDDWNTFSFSRGIPDDAVKVIVAYGINQGAPTSTGCVIFDELCFQVIGGTPPPPPSCSITAVVAETPCFDRGTNDPSDDGYNFTIDATATGGGSGYSVSWIQNGSPKSFNGTYGQQLFVGQNLITLGVLNLTISDNANSACSTTATVTPPAPCSGPQGGNGGDLELAATGTPSNVTAWANATSTFTLTNTGNLITSGIEVDFTLDAGSILRGGNEFDASQGTLQSFWTATPVWQVGSLAPGQSATIDLNLFTRTADAITVYGQVTEANENDPDSTPDNGTCCTANEDDEAAFTFNGSNPPPPTGTDLRVENVRLRNTPPTIIGQGVSAFFDGIIDGTPLNNSQFPITYALYLSTDNSLSANDTKVLDLGLGFGSNLQFGGQVPTSLAPGNYYLIVEIDSPNNITETNENNNWTSSASPISIINDPTTNLPDLTFGNLFINNAPTAGQVLNYNFNLTNAGTVAVSGNYNIKAYISTDNILSSDDIQDGIVPTGNTPVGTINTVPGASRIPSNLPQGSYFLILKVDADDQITESNEGNNIIFKPFDTQPITGGSSCAFVKNYVPQGIDRLGLSYDVSFREDGNGYDINYERIQPDFPNPDIIKTGVYELDLEGNVVNVNETISNVIENVKVERDGFDLTLFFESTTNPPAGTRVAIDYGTLPAGAQALGGFSLEKISIGYAIGIFIVDATGMAINRVIQTDNQGNVLRVDEMPTGGFYNGFSKLTEGPDGSLFAEYQTSGNNTLFGIPTGGSAWDFRVLSDTPSATWADTRVSPNGQWVVTSKTDNSNAIYAKINVQTGVVQSVDLAPIVSEGAPPGGFRRPRIGSAFPNDDGSVLYSVGFQNVIGADVGYIIGKMDSNGQQVWKQNFITTALSDIYLKPLGVTSDGGYLFAGNESPDKSFFVKTTADGALSPTCGGTNSGNGADLELTLPDFVTSPAQWSNFGTTLTLTNSGSQPATNIEVTFQKADEVVYQGGNEFSLSQGTFQNWGDQIWRVGDLAPGATATLDVNYFRLSANDFALYAQVSSTGEADLDSTPGNGTCCVANEDDEASLQIGSALRGGVNNRSAVAENLGNEVFAIVNASPNPTTGYFNLEVYANESQTSEITIVDILGKPIFRKEVNLNEGHNSIPIDLENRGTGMMMVKMTPFHPYLRQIRVMKIRD